MRRTLAALLFTLGLSACSGVEAPLVEEDTHSAMEACRPTEPMCADVDGTPCTTKFSQYCCQDGYWRAQCHCWAINGYRWACEQ